MSKLEKAVAPARRLRMLPRLAVLVAACAGPAQADIVRTDPFGNAIVQSLERLDGPGCRAVATCEEAARIMCSQPGRLFTSAADKPCENACASPDELRGIMARLDCPPAGFRFQGDPPRPE